MVIGVGPPVAVTDAIEPSRMRHPSTRVRALRVVVGLLRGEGTDGVPPEVGEDA